MFGRRIVTQIGLRFTTRASQLLGARYTTAALPGKEPISPLAIQLQQQIKAAGPLSVAQFMRQALTHPQHGYYMSRDVFGRQGDFITSPEVSQMFGELLAIWLVLQWKLLGCPARVRLLELGPGRGTLMDDVLRVARRFPDFHSTITGVHLVEVSPELRTIQRKRLCSLGADLHGETRIPVHWHSSIDEWQHQDDLVDASPLLLAHEFLDALPVHMLEKTQHGWREILIDLDASEDTPYHFRLVKAPSATPLAHLLADQSVYAKLPDGARVEVSPEVQYAAQKIARVVAERHGAALLVDYGNDFTRPNSLRGIRHHTFCDPLSKPGQTDLSADVDFSAIRKAVADLVDVHGPVSQQDFLHKMGIQARLKMLLGGQAVRDDPTLQKQLISSYQRLTDPQSMGTAYKCLALTPKTTPTPVAFESAAEAAA